MGGSIYLYGLLFTEDEWQDEELQLALLSDWADKANAGADADAYESFEVVVGGPSVYAS